MYTGAAFYGRLPLFLSLNRFTESLKFVPGGQIDITAKNQYNLSYNVRLFGGEIPMDQKTAAEELLQMLTQLTHQPELESTEQLARGEGALLWYLLRGHDGATAGEIRDAMEVGSGRVANALKSLVSKGFVTRAASESDGRVVRVYLTQEGRAFILARYQRTIQWITRLMEALGEEDSRLALRLSHRLLEISAQLRQAPQ